MVTKLCYYNFYQSARFWQKQLISYVIKRKIYNLLWCVNFNNLLPSTFWMWCVIVKQVGINVLKAHTMQRPQYELLTVLKTQIIYSLSIFSHLFISLCYNKRYQVTDKVTSVSCPTSQASHPEQNFRQAISHGNCWKQSGFVTEFSSNSDQSPIPSNIIMSRWSNYFSGPDYVVKNDTIIIVRP
jgi:hypothetical protein